MTPDLRFTKNEIGTIASRYEYQSDEDELIALKSTVTKRGYLVKKELLKLAKWKAVRSSGHIHKNSDEYIHEITGFSLKAKTERARIQTLTNLDGVHWPTASVVLHFFHSDPYPIIDYRALWSLSLEVPKQYNFNFWWKYVQICRLYAKEAAVSMRTLDRALWQYSKENQD